MTIAIDNNLAAREEVACAHCGQPVPPGLIDGSALIQFCCGGCHAVFDTLHACGLDAYYRLRDTATAPANPTNAKFASFDTSAFASLYVQELASNTASVDLVLEGVSCAACVWLLERLPHVLEGVIEARLSLRESTVRITWNPQRVRLSRIARMLDSLGYTPHPAKGVSRQDLFRREVRKRVINLAVAGALMGNTMLLALALYAGRFDTMEESYAVLFRWISAALGITALCWPGFTFFRSAAAALRVGRVNLDVPIAMALLVGGIAGLINVCLNRGDIYFDSLTVLVSLLLVGRFLQFRQQRQADASVELLFSLAPAICRIVREDGSVDELPTEALRKGDLVEVRSGETIPADGVIENGRSSVHQAILTGESMPMSVHVGEVVYGGAQNQGAALRIRVSDVGSDSRVGKLMRIVEQGVAEKPPIVQLADRVGGWFVGIVSVVAAGTFAYWSRFSMTQAIDHTVALLIVTCPCVLGLATPFTLAIAIGKLARRDILVKSGAAMEKLSRYGEIVLDKTGTLTFGDLRLLHWIGPESLQPIVAAIEQHSQHPIARALRDEFRNTGNSSVIDVIESPSGGISAAVDGHRISIGSPTFHTGNDHTIDEELDAVRREWEATGCTAVLIAVDGIITAAAGLGDEVRDDSAAAIAHLSKADWRPRILSGDANGVVAAVARRVGIGLAKGELTPEQKLAVVRSIQTEDIPRTVVMVGDGVNDAAALAAADVGIAVHGGAEASLAAADVYIATPGLAPLVELVQTARRTLRTIHRNLMVSLGYNLLAGVLAVTGHMNPMLAAIIMPISSATVLTMALASVRRRP